MSDTGSLAHGGLCVVCDRPFCRHDAAYYLPRYATPAAVATGAGETLRQRALSILTERYKTLAHNSTTYAFSPIEITVMEATGRAIETLQGMTPTGDLEPPRADYSLEEELQAAVL